MNGNETLESNEKPQEIRRVELKGPVAVIGDIHGERELLEKLLARLGDMPIVVVGDVIDRGPDAKGVVELLTRRGALGVRGNHEEWMRAWVDGRGFDSMAIHPFMGGSATLRSYGVVSTSPEGIDDERHLVPPDHKTWFLDLPLVLDLEVDGHTYWVIHAGVPTSVSFGVNNIDGAIPWMVKNSPDDLLWRSTKPEDMLPLSRPVIHGHVPHREPIDAAYAIAIDTGSGVFADGGLTAVILPSRKFVTVRKKD